MVLLSPSCLEGLKFLQSIDSSSSMPLISSSSGDGNMELSLPLLVSWLENRKIRALDIDNRSALQNESESWNEAFRSYLEKLDCPFEWGIDSTDDCLTWLLSYAINLEYEDAHESLPSLIFENECRLNHDTSNDAASPISSPDAPLISNEVLLALSQLTGVRRDEGELAYDFLTRVTKKCRFNSNNQDVISGKGTNHNLVDFTLGFDSGDETVNDLLRVLRMLHVSDFRELQTDLNWLIVAGQEFTANPKTNSALGKVGV